MAKSLDRLLSVQEVAELLGVPVRTIYEWRYRGEGPRGYRIGRHVRYRLSAVDEWLEAHADPIRKAA
ncbi:excisionase [Enemella evansiae]|uniref:helix-turn-helix transcriptional regulator n=1 Tax=Enemella evansiae TaxID=2016499 RepID=UPI000B9772A0|nr:helix-turn-helix domain-containing protein [Enemella evansiae]OYO09383.1 excisionase [Enemella evansiae]